MKKFGYVVLLGMLILLTGCALAKAEQPAGDEDRLLGVYVTDSETVLTEPVCGVVEQVETDRASRLTEIVFPGLCGHPLIMENRIGDDGHIILSAFSDDVFFGLSMGSHEKEGSDESFLQLSGELRWDLSQNSIGKMKVFPIYQTTNGEYYITEGQTVSAELGNGATVMQLFNESMTETDRKVIKGDSTEVKVNLSGGYPTKEVEVLQYGDDLVLYKRESFAADQLPSVYLVEESTCFVVILSHYTEETGRTAASVEAVGRDLLEQQDGHVVQLFLPGQDSFLQCFPMLLELKK